VLRHLRLFATFIGLQISASAGSRAQDSPTVVSLGTCRFAAGATIRDCRIAYRAFGRLNAARTNAVLIPTSLLGRSEDWLPLLGRDAYVDTTRFYTLVVDAFGDGHSSSPSNTPAEARTAFRELTIADMLEAQHRLLVEHLKLSQLHAVIGISMGGMQAFEWAVRYPTFAEVVIPIMSSPQLASFDQLLWTTTLSELENGRALGASDDSVWTQSTRLLTLFLRTSRAVNESGSASVASEVAKEAETLRKTWTLEDYAAQLRAVLRHDVAARFGGDLARAAKEVRGRMLVIFSWDDHMLTAGSGIAFAKYARADTLSISSSCGHTASVCEQARIGVVVREFLAR
jgi:homoserine O-acetyltransferase/O-succinyltransferase